MDAERKRIRRRVEVRAGGSMRMSETSAPARCRGGKLTGSGEDALQVRESVEGFQQRVKDEVAGGWRGWSLGRRLGGGDEVRLGASGDGQATRRSSMATETCRGVFVGAAKDSEQEISVCERETEAGGKREQGSRGTHLLVVLLGGGGSDGRAARGGTR